MASNLHQYGIRANTAVSFEDLAKAANMLNEELQIACEYENERWRLRKIGRALASLGRIVLIMHEEEEARTGGIATRVQ